MCVRCGLTGASGRHQRGANAVLMPAVGDGLVGGFTGEFVWSI